MRESTVTGALDREVVRRIQPQIRCNDRDTTRVRTTVMVSRLAFVTGVLVAAPVEAAPMTGIVDLAAGNTAACAVLTGGDVACWGRQEHFSTATAPAYVANVHGAVSVSVSDDGACAVLATGEVSCWGVDWYTGRKLPTWGHGGQPPGLVFGITDATQVTVGHGAACARHRTGKVSCWGDNRYGQLGAQTADEHTTEPVAVPGIADAVEVDIGITGTCARLRSQQIACWHGRNSTTTPTVVPGLSDAVGVAVGQRACAVHATGRVSCWSVDTPGKLVDVGVDRAVAIVDNNALTCATEKGGTVRCWGSGFVGDGTRRQRDATPTPLPKVSDAAQVALGMDFGCVRHVGGTATCWGENWVGQLGYATPDAVGAPVAVRGVTGATAVSVGRTMACALTADGARCWGNGRPAQAIAGTKDAVQLSVATTRACVTMKHGAVACWDADGGLLATPLAGVTDAIQVVAYDPPLGRVTCIAHRGGAVTCDGDRTTGWSKITDAAQLALGYRQRCARTASGDARCWDDKNTIATLATDVRQVATTAGPVCVLGKRGEVRCSGGVEIRVGNSVQGGADLVAATDPAIEQIAVGFAHVCSRRKDGAVACWGYNTFGQLGTGTIERAVHPAATVTLPKGAIDIAASANTTCAVLRGGTVSCWGNNDEGQVGDGTTGIAYTLGRSVERVP